MRLKSSQLKPYIFFWLDSLVELRTIQYTLSGGISSNGGWETDLLAGKSLVTVDSMICNCTCGKNSQNGFNPNLLVNINIGKRSNEEQLTKTNC